MKIQILNSELTHPINPYLIKFKEELKNDHEISIIRSINEITEGDILFLVSFHEIVSKETCSNFLHSIVLHASDLPEGRGWSPHIWELIEGKTEITLSMLAVHEKVDAGDIYLKKKLYIPPTALWDEINDILFTQEINLMRYAVKNLNSLRKHPQKECSSNEAFRKRTPEDSRIDANISLQEQFNLIRVCDPNRYPAFFELDGRKFKIILEKIDK